jgi:D-glycero-D-manno-heptose 1,7-bisphosphate phosphatase
MIRLDFFPAAASTCCLVVLDRDNTLIFDPGYVHKKESLEFLPGVLEALKRARDHGSEFVITTNQGGIGLGKFREVDFVSLTTEMVKSLAGHGIEIQSVFACPHHPESINAALRDCTCRKPKAGMLLSALAGKNVALSNVVVFGDSEKDILMADAVGVSSYLVEDNLPLLVDTWISLHEKSLEMVPE